MGGEIEIAKAAESGEICRYERDESERESSHNVISRSSNERTL